MCVRTNQQVVHTEEEKEVIDYITFAVAMVILVIAMHSGEWS
jgi:hypothetical protein